MADRIPSRELLQQYRSGESDAAAELHRRYAARLLTLAERMLKGPLRRRLDADDLVQSVFRTFFRRVAHGEYSVQHSGALWHLLMGIAENKMRIERRRHHAAKRDLSAEIHLDPSTASLAVNVPSPEELAVLMDEIECLLAGLGPVHVKIIHGALEGAGVGEIAAEVQRSRSTVRRVLSRTIHRLSDRLKNG